MEQNKCYIGQIKNEQCHLEHYTVKKDMLQLSSLSNEDIQQLSSRVENFDILKENEFICKHHFLKYITYFSCCDPYNVHKKNVKTTLRSLESTYCQKFKNLTNIEIAFGSKVCSNCATKIISIVNSDNGDNAGNSNDSHSYVSINNEKIEIDNESLSTSTPTLTNSEQSEYQSKSQQTDCLKRMLDAFDEPPLKRGKLSYERFVNNTFGVLDIIQNKFIDKVNESYDINIPTPLSISELKLNNDYFVNIITNLQSRYQQSINTSEKISLLTLLPVDWKLKTVKKYFECSRYMLLKAKRLKEQKGVLASVTRKKYYIISTEIKESILNYYRDDSTSKLCSGMKECVKVTIPGSDNSEQIQKRLLLHDLKDLYNHWQETCSSEKKISFSMFASLRPKECILAGLPGTHTVCVCSHHQNIKLKLAAFNRDLYCRDILKDCVCSVDNENCMLHYCNECPGMEAIRKVIQSNCDENRKIISYKNWMNYKNSKLRSTSISVKLYDFEESLEQFTDTITQDLWNLTEHHFVSESQRNYLLHCKNILDFKSCIVLMDFAENYTFICQESIQAFYFSNTQATLHPFVIYYKTESENELKTLSICIISDSLKHNASSVNLFQERYKNKNNFINLCYHDLDFKMKVISYNFFATSHGKSVCDGIGAVAKRAVRKASLQRPIDEQILTPEQMFEYLDKNVTGIRFLWVNEKDVETRSKKLQKRFQSAKTLKDTRKQHCIIPLDRSTLKMKVTSFSDHFEEIQF